MNAVEFIGGYFELELPRKNEHYHDAIKLNTAKNALKLVLDEKKPDLIYVPLYLCQGIFELFNSLNLPYTVYNLDKHLEPLNLPVLSTREMFLYVNYFSIKEKYSEHLEKIYSNKLIVDNCQAFYALPSKESYSIYSARKFFGVPDGAYLYGLNHSSTDHLTKDVSLERMHHLLGRIASSPADYYDNYLQNEKLLTNQPVKSMSILTDRILGSIDYQQVRQCRENNFALLHHEIGYLNQLPVDLSKVNGPMAYPLLIKQKGLKDYLIENNVFIATYWPEIVTPIDSAEKDFVSYLLALPVDQRYGADEMQHIALLIKIFLDRNHD
jgi:hypothetical protein